MAGLKNNMKPERRSRLMYQTEFSAKQLRSQACKSDHHCIASKFLALADLVDGESCAAVARRYRVSTAAVYQWIHRLNEQGTEEFNKNRRRGRKCNLDNQYALGPEDLALAAKAADLKSSRRLLAVSRVLQDVPCIEVAHDAHISPSTLTGWIKRFNEHGIAGLVSSSGVRPRARRGMRIDIPVCEVRAAAGEAPRRTSRRLTAVAQVLDGEKMVDVARSLDVSISAVSKWCRQYNQNGIEGLADHWEARASRLLKKNSFPPQSRALRADPQEV